MAPAASTAPARRILLVLDLNGTLLARLTKHQDRQSAHAHPRAARFSAAFTRTTINGSPVYLRPHLSDFLRAVLRRPLAADSQSRSRRSNDKTGAPRSPTRRTSLTGSVSTLSASAAASPTASSTSLAAAAAAESAPDTKFVLAIWTSAMKRNAEPLVEAVLGSMGDAAGASSRGRDLFFLWDRERVTMVNALGPELVRAYTKMNNGKIKPHSSVKDLRVIWEEFEEFDETNTLLIDDTMAKALLTPQNVLVLPTFELGDHSVDPTQDVALRELSAYLDRMAREWDGDVRAYVKRKPFTARPSALAASSHPSVLVSTTSRTTASRSHDNSAQSLPPSRRLSGPENASEKTKRVSTTSEDDVLAGLAKLSVSTKK